MAFAGAGGCWAPTGLVYGAAARGGSSAAGAHSLGG